MRKRVKKVKRVKKRKTIKREKKEKRVTLVDELYLWLLFNKKTYFINNDLLKSVNI